MMANQGQIQKRYKVIIAATGSVASLKLIELAIAVSQWAQVKVVLTQSAKKFVNKDEIQELRMKRKIEVHSDEDEWLVWNKRGDPVLHIQLRKWADALIIAPLSANTLAKIATGVCDNLATLVCRCWDMTLRQEPQKETEQQQKEKTCKGQVKLKNPIVICPAMNTMMWQHPITEEQLIKLKKWGYTIVDPVEKVLVCGDQGKGAMASIEDILKCIKHQLRQKDDEQSKENTKIRNL